MGTMLKAADIRGKEEKERGKLPKKGERKEAKASPFGGRARRVDLYRSVCRGDLISFHLYQLARDDRVAHLSLHRPRVFLRGARTLLLESFELAKPLTRVPTIAEGLREVVAELTGGSHRRGDLDVWPLAWNLNWFDQIAGARGGASLGCGLGRVAPARTVPSSLP